jgi:hypothetical protein
MEQTFGLYFHLKKNKKSNDVERAVYMRITVDGAFTEISAKRKCQSVYWNIESGRMNNKMEESRLFNSYLDTRLKVESKRSRTRGKRKMKVNPVKID